MKSTSQKLYEAFEKFIGYKNELIKENIPSHIKINSAYLNECINSCEDFNFSFGSEGMFITISFFGEEYEVPMVIDNTIETCENVFA